MARLNAKLDVEKSARPFILKLQVELLCLMLLVFKMRTNGAHAVFNITSSDLSNIHRSSIIIANTHDPSGVADCVLIMHMNTALAFGGMLPVLLLHPLRSLVLQC